MKITRHKQTYEGSFTQIPNRAVRDKNLSLKARGLLVELLSHDYGWTSSLASLQSSKDGRVAVSTAVDELVEAGYLVRSQTRGDAGLFGEISYEVTAYPTKPQVAPNAGFPQADKPLADKPHADNQTLRIQNNKNIKEQKTKEEETLDQEFDVFWSKYPLKRSKAKAKDLWGKARKLATLEEILKGLEAYRLETKDTEPRFIKHATTWLAQECWNDEYEPSAQVVELTKMIEEKNMFGIRSLTGINPPNFDELSYSDERSIKENSLKRKELVDAWLKENQERLFASLS